MTPNINHFATNAAGLAKIRRTVDGLVFERYLPDARELMDQGGFAFVSGDTASFREQLLAQSPANLRTITAALSVHGYEKDENAQEPTALIRVLVHSAEALSDASSILALLI